MASNVRKELRNTTVGKEPEFKKEIEKWNGKEFEIRQPSVSQKSKIMSKCRISIPEEEQDSENVGGVTTADFDYGEMQIWSVIYCTYVPDTDQRVFEENDKEMLAKQPSGSFVDQFGATAMRLMNVEPEEDRKNSDSESQG